MKKIAEWILSIIGWKVIDYRKEKPANSVICIAPHTSNWDFILGQLYNKIIQQKAYFLMKKEWFFFPFGYILKAMGGIPVNRKKKSSTVENIKELISQKKNIHIAITPEGTRKKKLEWHKGFYHIAKDAGLPIQIAVIDYKKKLMGLLEVFYPTGDIDKDLAYIKSFYNKEQAKYPEYFA